MQMEWAKQCWLLLICLLFISCGDSAPVDRQYLESDEYTQFSEKQQEEYAAQIKDYQTLRKYLTEFTNCQKGIERQLPLQINFSILKESKNECEEVDDKFNTNFDTQIFGYSSLKDVIIRWIILKKESAYIDAELLAVTYRDGEMIDFQTVGVFRENLSQDISTHISVSRKDDFVYISSAMDRGIKYPFEYDNIIESEFRVDTLGVIHNRATQTKSYQSLPKYLEESYSFIFKGGINHPIQH